MEIHPAVADLCAAHPEQADVIMTALHRGIMVAAQRRNRINKSETATLPLLAQGLVRGVVLTKLLLTHFDWLESNGLGGTEKKSAKELTKLVREQYHFLRAKATKSIRIQGEGTPAQKMSAYLDACTDLFWDIFEEADHADDARLMLALAQCYNEGLVRDSETGNIVSAEDDKMPRS